MQEIQIFILALLIVLVEVIKSKEYNIKETGQMLGFFMFKTQIENNTN